MLVPASPCCSADVRSCFTDRMVGRMPSKRPVPTDTASVKSNTRTSILASTAISIGRGGVRASSPRVAALATASPHNPPMSEMSRLSVSSCRTSRVRLAPTDARIANSLRRARERASSRLAMFAQAISRTSATTPSRPQPSGATPGSCRVRLSCSVRTGKHQLAVFGWVGLFQTARPGIELRARLSQCDLWAGADQRLTTTCRVQLVSLCAWPGMACACIIIGTQRSAGNSGSVCGI